jgi:cysteine-rich repeat protein
VLGQTKAERPARAVVTYIAAGDGQAVLQAAPAAELLGAAGKPAPSTFSVRRPELVVIGSGDELRLLPGVHAAFEGSALELHTSAGSASLPHLVLGDDPEARAELALKLQGGPTLAGLVGTSLHVEPRAGETVLILAADLQLRVRDPLSVESARVGPIVGRLTLSLPVSRTGALPAPAEAAEKNEANPRTATGTCTLNPGPDVIVGSLLSCQQFGRIGQVGLGMVGLSIGTISCNQGCEELSWYSLPSTAHPLIGMNLYRLSTHDGAVRFEQIGHSWLKHGFTALQEDNCEFGCVSSGTGSRLGVGCSDPYSTSLNSNQCGLGPRALVNPFTGSMPEGQLILDAPCQGNNFPARNHAGHTHEPGPSGAIAHRLQVHDADLMPALNPGAVYFGEAFYVTSDEFTNADALANGNMFNNVSHRKTGVAGPSGGMFAFNWLDSTQRELPALAAWTGATVADIEPAPGTDGRALLAWQVTDLGAGKWHYEYAVYNMNLDRAIRGLGVPIPSKVEVSAIGFHAPPNHDDPGVAPAEQFSNEPWSTDLSPGHLTWSTATFDDDPQANAVRFGTLYNFRFDADSPPQAAQLGVSFFKTGGSLAVMAQAPGPAIPTDCGDRILAPDEECDPPDGLHCDEDCQWICGDGVVQSGEDCDPPDGVNCDSACLDIVICGNGKVEDGEDCDPPNGKTCDGACQRIPTCGDGFLDAGEACDDGNTEPGDGCSPECTHEDNDSCASANVITDGTFLVITQGATTDGPAHPQCAQSGDGGITAYDRWFRYTAECSGNLTVSTCGQASYDTDLVVYNGVDCEDLVLLGCNDDAIECPARTSGLFVPVAAGHEYLIRLGGWNVGDPNSQGAAFLSVEHDNVPCPTLGFVTTNPPAGAIDARQPSQLDGSDVAGWEGIDIIFDEDATGLSLQDFEVTLEPPGPNIGIDDVQAAGLNVHVAFTQPLPPGYWLRLTFLQTGQSVRIGFLPGDVNADRTSSPLDILALVDHLNGVVTLPLHSTDADRSGLAQPQDILRLIDLLNGAGAYEEWNGRTLPE